MTVREYLACGKPLIFDGAMGTCFAERTHAPAESCERANLTSPDEIKAIHSSYLAAGCKAIKTNTFSVGALFSAGNEEEGVKLIKSACRIAEDAAGEHSAFVFGDMGPIPASGGISTADVYIRQAELFLSCGVKDFLIETLSSDDGIAEFAKYLKSKNPESYLIVSYAVGDDGFTIDGHLGKELFLRTAENADIDATGFNCMSGPHRLLKYIQTLDIGDTVLSVMPNAGYPSVLGRRTVYHTKTEYFADQIAKIVESGALIVGGCCGTTPAHIAAAAERLDDPSLLARRTPHDKKEPSAKGSRFGNENRLREKLESGKRIVAVELDPPIDDDLQPFLDGVSVLRDAGADVITISDCPIGRPRADSSLLACRLKREMGVEVLPHMTCRDRNLNAIKALLLGLSMEGIHNVLLVTGDPVPTAERNEVKSVFNFNSRKLIRYVKGLNDTVLHTPFCIFGALNLNAVNFDVQLRLALEKEENGASGFLTQPVHSAEALENLKLARRTLKGKLIGGVFPIISHRNACFLNNEVSGIRVCQEIVDLYEGKERDECEKVAVRVSDGIMKAMEPYVDGFYLMTPFKRVELMEQLISSARNIIQTADQKQKPTED